jgi:hypothetical protein
LNRARLAGPRAFLIATLTVFGCGGGCAARGHIATPAELVSLRESRGLSSSGTITLSGPGGRLRTKIVLGVTKPDLLRIEIPAGARLRFLLISTGGRLRADLPGDDAMFEGAASREVLETLFGVDFEVRDLVSALLGGEPEGMKVSWRFDAGRPSRIEMDGKEGRKLSLSLDDVELQAPAPSAFAFGPARGEMLSLDEMSRRLGLRR